jgi:outer membrane protein assembly factor BamB
VAADRLLYCGSDLAESGEMLLVTTDGEALLRREVMGRPALDRDSGVIAAHLPGGGVAAFSATTGEEIWSWSAQEAESRLLTAGRGGFLLGGLGQDNIVVASATGQVLLVEPFYHVPDAQWNGSVAIRFENAGLTGRQGSGPLLGQQITGAQDLMFLRAGG